MPFNSDKTFRNTKILLAIISSYFLFNYVSIELQVDLTKNIQARTQPQVDLTKIAQP